MKMKRLACGIAGLAALAAGMSTDAAGAGVRIQHHEVPLVYDEYVWTASTDDDGVNFSCDVESCGGKDASCSAYAAEPKDAAKAKAFFELYLNEMLPDLIEWHRSHGSSPLVIDPPARTLDGGRFSDNASFRYVDDGATWRFWFAVIQEPFGVSVLTCNVRESRFIASEPERRKLANSFPAGRP